MQADPRADALAIGAGDAATFSRAAWPRLERLSITLGGTASERRALARILATALPRLQTLEIDAYQLPPAGIDAIVRSPIYPRLCSLTLRDRAPCLADPALTALASRRTSLAALWLSLAGVTAKGLATLARLAARLDRLELMDCPLDAPRLIRLAKIPHIATIAFLGAPDAAGLAALLAGMPGLERLVLGAARTAGAAHCAAIAGARQLRELAITEAPLGDDAARLGALANLETLELQSTRIGDAGATALPALRRLRTLGLQFCGIGNAGGAALARWPARSALQTINVNGNHILDPAIQARLKRRFASLHPVALLGYQHPVPDPDEQPEPEPPPPEQRPQRALPPRRRDWRAGLRELVGRDHFASWDGYVDAKLIARAETLIDRCAEAILALGEDATATAQRAALRRCITGFNRFSARIHTIEAEDIVTTFDAIARYTKLAKDEDLSGAWRDF